MVEVQTPENEPPIKVDITFDRFAEIMREMKLAGIDRAEVCSVGGTAGGFDGRFPDVLPIPEEFGGEQKYKEAVAFGKSLGYQMTVQGHTPHRRAFVHNAVSLFFENTPAKFERERGVYERNRKIFARSFR